MFNLLRKETKTKTNKTFFDDLFYFWSLLWEIIFMVGWRHKRDNDICFVVACFRFGFYRTVPSRVSDKRKGKSPFSPASFMSVTNNDEQTNKKQSNSWEVLFNSLNCINRYERNGGTTAYTRLPSVLISYNGLRLPIYVDSIEISGSISTTVQSLE